MKIPFGLHKDTKQYIGIDEASNGLSCNCICPSCGMSLNARQGKENEHHFAHHEKAKITCLHSYWVSIRSMAKQIIQKKGISVEDTSVYSFSLIPYTQKSKRKILHMQSDPRIQENQFDIKVSTSLGVYYIHLITDDEDMGRSRKHANNLSRKNTFSAYLVLELDISSLIRCSNKDARCYLENLIRKSPHAKTWFSTHSSYLKTSKETKLVKKEREEIFPHYVDQQSQETKILVKKMIAFATLMQKSYTNKTKGTNDLSVMHRGKSLWYVSCCFEFFYISIQEDMFIVYEVEENMIKRLTSCFYFKDLDFALKKYIIQRDNIL